MAQDIGDRTQLDTNTSGLAFDTRVQTKLQAREKEGVLLCTGTIASLLFPDSLVKKQIENAECLSKGLLQVFCDNSHNSLIPQSQE